MVRERSTWHPRSSETHLDLVSAGALRDHGPSLVVLGGHHANALVSSPTITPAFVHCQFAVN
jgi:hypothetical protein